MTDWLIRPLSIEALAPVDMYEMRAPTCSSWRTASAGWWPWVKAVVQHGTGTEQERRDGEEAS